MRNTLLLNRYSARVQAILLTEVRKYQSSVARTIEKGVRPENLLALFERLRKRGVALSLRLIRKLEKELSVLVDDDGRPGWLVLSTLGAINAALWSEGAAPAETPLLDSAVENIRFEGRTIGESIGGAMAAMVLRNEKTIADAVGSEMEPAALKRKLEPSRFTEDLAAAHMRTEVRTAFASVATDTKNRIFLLLTQVIGVRASVVLDGVTTEICTDWVDRVWKYEGLDLVPMGHSTPYLAGPPNHRNCRTMTYPVCLGWGAPAIVSYDNYLRSLNSSEQKTVGVEVLGADAFARWKAGATVAELLNRVNVADFLDNQALLVLE